MLRDSLYYIINKSCHIGGIQAVCREQVNITYISGVKRVTNQPQKRLQHERFL